jgi:hypothetical protein
MDNFYNENQKGGSVGSNLDSKLVYIGVTAVFVFGLVYLVGRAWKKSQTT